MKAENLRRIFEITLFLFLPFVGYTADINSFYHSGYVNDFAGIINEAEKLKLSRLCEKIEELTGTQIAVVTISSLEGESLEDFTNMLFNKWRLGKKGKDNGLMFLISVYEKKIRIETGYGIEGIIPDSTAYRIIKDVMVPYFKNEEYAAGIYNGVYQAGLIIAKAEGKEFDIKNSDYAVRTSAKKLTVLEKIQILIFIFIFIPLLIKNPWLLLVMAGSGRNSFRLGGGFGSGGFGGFGGGSSGGGGASGGW